MKEPGPQPHGTQPSGTHPESTQAESSVSSVITSKFDFLSQ